MEVFQRKDSRTISRLTCHKVWEGDVQFRCRELLLQICDSEDVKILKGVISSDHVHMHIEYPPKINISGTVKRLKGRSSRILQKEFAKLKQ